MHMAIIPELGRQEDGESEAGKIITVTITTVIIKKNIFKCVETMAQ